MKNFLEFVHALYECSRGTTEVYLTGSNYERQQNVTNCWCFLNEIGHGDCTETQKALMESDVKEVRLLLWGLMDRSSTSFREACFHLAREYSKYRVETHYFENLKV